MIFLEKLTIKEQRFCEYYVQSGKLAESYVKAGYKASSDIVASVSANRMLKKPKIQSCIKELNEAVTKDTIMAAQEIQERLTSLARGETEEECVVVISEGDGCSSAKKINKKVSAKEQVKALELLGKINLLFAEADKNANTTTIEIKIGSEENG